MPADRTETSLDLPILGLRTRFVADDPALLTCVAEAFGAWRGLPMPEGPPSARLALALRGDGPASAPQFSVHEPRLFASAAGARGRADASRGVAACALSAAWLREPARLAEEVLDALVLFLLTARDRMPLHAAGVVMGDTALLLAGASGSGKSTLAAEAARRGLPVLSDDTLYLQRDPTPRVWGFPRPIHVLPGGQHPPAGDLRLRGGRWKRRVYHPSAGDPLSAEHAVLIRLERGTEVRLRPIPRREAVAAVGGVVDAGFDRFAADLPSTLHAVTSPEAWRLTLSADPGEALDALAGVFGGVGTASGHPLA